MEGMEAKSKSPIC